jgi:hypothetical protein
MDAFGERSVCCCGCLGGCLEGLWGPTGRKFRRQSLGTRIIEEKGFLLTAMTFGVIFLTNVGDCSE